MKLVSVDLGAQSGRVAVGSFDGRRLSVSEVHRFPNVPVKRPRKASLGPSSAV